LLSCRTPTSTERARRIGAVLHKEQSMTQAMRIFAAWVSSRSYRSILLAIVLVQIMAPLAGALLVLDALRRGPRAALLAAAVASAGFTAIGIALGASALEATSLCLPLVVGALSGALLAWSRSLSLAFQATVTGFTAVALAAFALVVHPDRLGSFLLNEALRVLELSGLDAAQLELLMLIQPLDMTRMLLCVLLASSLLALLLGFWWHSLIATAPQFGTEFRQLRLGRVAAVILMAVVAAALVWRSPAVSAVAPLAALGFLFQGLAVLHARRHSEGWHRAVMPLVYLLLISPLALWIYLGVSAIGLLDNFFTLRARVEPRA
jgi:hypothetical protein